MSSRETNANTCTNDNSCQSRTKVEPEWHLFWRDLNNRDCCLTSGLTARLKYQPGTEQCWTQLTWLAPVRCFQQCSDWCSASCTEHTRLIFILLKTISRGLSWYTLIYCPEGTVACDLSGICTSVCAPRFIIYYPSNPDCSSYDMTERESSMMQSKKVGGWGGWEY